MTIFAVLVFLAGATVLLLNVLLAIRSGSLSVPPSNLTLIRSAQPVRFRLAISLEIVAAASLFWIAAQQPWNGT